MYNSSVADSAYKNRKFVWRVGSSVGDDVSRCDLYSIPGCPLQEARLGDNYKMRPFSPICLLACASACFAGVS